jgi:hypothetical protein
VTRGAYDSAATHVRAARHWHWGQPHRGRDFASLKKFADENLGPSCSNDYFDLCDDEQKATLEKYNAMTPAERQKLLDDAEKAVEDVNRTCCRC